MSLTTQQQAYALVKLERVIILLKNSPRNRSTWNMISKYSSSLRHKLTTKSNKHSLEIIEYKWRYFREIHINSIRLFKENKLKEYNSL